VACPDEECLFHADFEHRSIPALRFFRRVSRLEKSLHVAKLLRFADLRSDSIKIFTIRMRWMRLSQQRKHARSVFAAKSAAQTLFQRQQPPAGHDTPKRIAPFFIQRSHPRRHDRITGHGNGNRSQSHTTTARPARPLLARNSTSQTAPHSRGFKSSSSTDRGAVPLQHHGYGERTLTRSYKSFICA